MKAFSTMTKDEFDNFVIKNVFALKRASEHKRFTDMIFNRKLLYHGSRIGNWLGILSRGLLLPAKTSGILGVKRTDYGLLGSGLYFGDQMTTCAKYTSKGKHNTRLMLLCTVALGNIKSFTQQEPSLTSPPVNYHSCRSVR